MSISLDDLTFEVIGSTVTFTPDNLPRRLRPIYRRIGDDHVWFTAVTRNREESTELAALDPDDTRCLAEEGEVLLWDEPLPARIGHVLLQVSPSGAPEYLPWLDVPLRLRQAESDALRRAADSFALADQDATLRWVWYARRASLDDPLPLLLLMKLLERAGEPAEDLAVLGSELHRFDRASLDAARERLQTLAALAPFASLHAKPAYLPAGARAPNGAPIWARGSSSRSQ